jgi:hypothetical protein
MNLYLALDDIYKVITRPDLSDQAQIDEGKQIIQNISKFRYELLRDRELTLLQDSLMDVELWNTFLKLYCAGKGSFQLPFLYFESYVRIFI